MYVSIFVDFSTIYAHNYNGNGWQMENKIPFLIDYRVTQET